MNLSKVELDITNSNYNSENIVTNINKHKIKTIVVGPKQIQEFIMKRSSVSRKFKIVVAVGSGNKVESGLNKFFHLPPVMEIVDGYDVVVLNTKDENVIINELRAVKEFVRSNDQITELRWIFNDYNIGCLGLYLNHMKKYAPNMLCFNTVNLPDLKNVKTKIACPIRINCISSDDLVSKYLLDYNKFLEITRTSQ